MLQRLMSRRSFLLGVVGVVMSTMLTLWGCGGGGGTSSYSQSVTTTSAPAIIDAATLKKWIDEGKLNAPFGTKDRVVVVSPSTTADWTNKGHIPGAVRWDPTELAMTRIEGLASATNMMPTGAFMDSVIQRLGIDGNTTIVISLPKSSTIHNQSLVFWDLRYWGFAKNRIKILNGGDDAWDVAGYSLSTDAIAAYTSSNYSVKQNGKLASGVRYSITDMIAKIDAFIADSSQLNTWQIIDVRGTSYPSYITGALRQTSSTQFMVNVNGDTTKNFMYPTKDVLINKFQTLPVNNGATTTFIDPTKKTICYCNASSSASPTFVLFDAVLGVADGYIQMYDGSASQFSLYSQQNIEKAFPNSTQAQRVAWSFNNDNSTAQSNLNRAQGISSTEATDVSLFTVAPVLLPSDAHMNQILIEDSSYMTPTSTSTTSSGGGSASGC